MNTHDPPPLSDKQAILSLLTERNGPKAMAAWNHLQTLHTMVLGGFVEWCLQWPATLAAQTSPAQERSLTQKVWERWKKNCASLQNDAESAAALEQLTALFHPDRLAPQATGQATMAQAALESISGRSASVRQAIESGDFDRAAREVHLYFTVTLAVHDALTLFVSDYGTMLYRELGQETAELAGRLSFSRCSFHEPFFQYASTLKPEQLAPFLAEHLRGHFSGPGREGSVRIVEEQDRFRLIFEPCGSGGAMRQRQLEQGTAPETYAQPAPVTWNRSGEVPSYCSHCAVNELEFSRRVGFPAVVTEFHPDAARPCGWTVYKDPNLIPERYFARLGLKKNPSNFKRP